MKKILSIFILFLTPFCFAHSIHSETTSVQKWHVLTEQEPIVGSYYLFKNGQVYLEDLHGKLMKYPISVFEKEDQNKIRTRQHKIEVLNRIHSIRPVVHYSKSSGVSPQFLKFVFFSLIVLVLGIVLQISEKSGSKQKWNPLLFLGFGLLAFSFTFSNKKHSLILKSLTDPAFLDSAFIPFAPNVNTFQDGNYYYVESQGIPSTHEMMVGISNHGWQQQVPIPQCYIGSNAWSIPLNPVIATTPVPVNASHFLRGAIAIAVNGVPIFNYHTNTGVDSYLDGQLDNYGGHCGRGDDYHYHIAPLHLYAYTASTKPIAFALDGFAIYGNVEPDGTTMEPLDANHGHVGVNGIYHYHGTSTAPYMIGNMVGQVTEDNTLQIIPQAQAQPVRTENWTPLSGALITSCTSNGTNNGYNLSYTLNGISGYATNYSWNPSGVYTFNYVTPSGSTSTTYNGFLPCDLISNLGIIEAYTLDVELQLYPNPAHDILYLRTTNHTLEESIKELSIYTIDGTLKWKSNQWNSEISIKSLSKGAYLLKLQFPTGLVSRKFSVY